MARVTSIDKLEPELQVNSKSASKTTALKPAETLSRNCSALFVFHDLRDL